MQKDKIVSKIINEDQDTLARLINIGNEGNFMEIALFNGISIKQNLIFEKYLLKNKLPIDYKLINYNIDLLNEYDFWDI